MKYRPVVIFIQNGHGEISSTVQFANVSGNNQKLQDGIQESLSVYHLPRLHWNDS